MKLILALLALAYGGFMGAPQAGPPDCLLLGCKAVFVTQVVGGCAVAPFVTDGTLKTNGACDCQQQGGGVVVCVPDPGNESQNKKCSIVGNVTISNPAAAAGGFGGPGTCVCVGGFGVPAGAAGNVPINMVGNPQCPLLVTVFSVDIKLGPCVMPIGPPGIPLCPGGANACSIIVGLICMDCNLGC